MNIIASTSKQPYVKFVAEMLNELEQTNVEGIAVVALCGDQALTGYWDMSLQDKERAEMEIRRDCTDELIRNNADRYTQIFDEAKEGDFEE